MLAILRNKYWDILKRTGLYPFYVVADCYLKVMFCYWRQRLGKEGLPVVIIDHNFIQDIDALGAKAGGAGINLIRIPYEPIYFLACRYFSAEIREGSYLVPEMLQPREAYRKLLGRFFSLWRPEQRIRAFLAPSDTFFWIREIIALLKERDVPCIVVDKEGTISPYFMEEFSKDVTQCFPSISDAIIVWSERQREFWKRTGVTDEKIFVAGQPRSDFFFNPSAWLPRERLLSKFERMVLFFSFETDAYAPVPGDHIWKGLRRDIHDSLVDCARRYPEFLFVVKTHPQQLDNAQVQAEFAAVGLENIRVLSGPELSRHLIVHADLVIGFQTTALIEAMLAGKRVVYTEWSGAVLDNRHNLIPFHDAEGIDIAHSRAEFQTLLHTILDNEAFSVAAEAAAARKPLVDVFIPNADGEVSGRVMARVRAIIDAANSPIGRSA